MTGETSSPLAEADNLRPKVALPVTNRGVWIFVALAALGATVLFSALEARRSEDTQDPFKPLQVQGQGMIEPPPPLEIPQPQAGMALAQPAIGPRPIGGGISGSSLPSMPVARRLLAPARLRAVRAPNSPAPVVYDPPAPLPPFQAGPATVYQASAMAQPAPPPGGQAKDNARVKAARFANPSLTVPQGAVIQAVLETALDSNHPGPARAIVSRDVRGFDGSTVLIPRGSRLYGEYKADVSSGQNRALIQWTRLMRPDGVLIALDSPSADPLGRAGVKGKVNSHFLARFGNALLQTSLNIGMGLATRDLGGGTIVLGLPGSMQSIATPASEQIKPTLSVRQGSPVSVFVARDLDFSDVE